MDGTMEAISRITARRKTMHFANILDWANQLKTDKFPTQGELCEIHEEPERGMYALKLSGLNYLCEFFEVLDKTGSRCKVRNIKNIGNYRLAILMEY